MYKSNNLVVGNRDHFNWPPPPPLEMVSWSMKRPCPPKPDTPPSPVSNCFFLIIYFYIIIFHHHNESHLFQDSNPWNHWTTNICDSALNLSIQLPIMQNPKLLGNPFALISPARHLLPPDQYIWGNNGTSIASPDPTELPIPDKLIHKGRND